MSETAIKKYRIPIILGVILVSSCVFSVQWFHFNTIVDFRVLTDGVEYWALKSDGSVFNDVRSIDATRIIQSTVDGANYFERHRVFIEKTVSDYQIVKPINIISNIEVKSNGATLKTDSTWSWFPNNGIFHLTDADDVIITGLNFRVDGLTTPAILSFGGRNQQILNNTFTGASESAFGLVGFQGLWASDNLYGLQIKNNLFYNILNTVPINIAPYGGTIQNPTSGYSANNIDVLYNVFNNVHGPAVVADGTAPIDNVLIQYNDFLEVRGDTYPPKSYGYYGSAFFGGISKAYQLSNVKILNNYYKKTIREELSFFAQVYCTKNVEISNNVAIAPVYFDTPSGPGSGFFAPGRVDWPDINVIVKNNTVYGFESWWDPDSMRNAEIYDNTFDHSGIPTFGYGIQENVNIHNNVFNEPHITPNIPTMIVFGTSNAKASRFAYNTVTVNRLNSGFLYGLGLGGGWDYSDIIFEGNVLKLNGNLAGTIYNYDPKYPLTYPKFQGTNDFDGVQL